MSESASPAKRNVEDVSAPEVVDDAKRSKGDVQESVLGAEGDEGAAEAGPSTGENVDEDEVDEDELAALDQANIITGPRTRGKKIDFRKASEEAGGDEEDDDEDADVTANTTMPKTDDGTSDEEEEVEVEGEGDAEKGEEA
ncbi:MAG: hypothetical protein CYPHOPRED_002840 [Cyphobasidiales sp. Tagirdzhanova-0007]|nr:MAG: hypothetical protein CYPHOPRED_002840 [Cyphobasidiales sp. Tagirdzhanova-0007]